MHNMSYIVVIRDRSKHYVYTTG